MTSNQPVNRLFLKLLFHKKQKPQKIEIIIEYSHYLLVKAALNFFVYINVVTGH